MARRSETVAIPTTNPKNRDAGKVYRLVEMSAEQAEAWGTRALLALVRNGGANISEETASMGLMGVAMAGVNALGGIQYDELKPLLDEMMACVTRQPDPTRPEITRPLNGDSDIEEVTTRLLLRERLLDLHLGFSARSVLSVFQARAQAMKTTDGGTPTIPTSPPTSGSSSAAA